MSVDSLFAIGPRTLGRYELLAPVARGGMGQVWVGRLRGARGFNKLVAVKTLLSMPDAEGRLEGMLFEEARIASLIHHANVVQTLELGEHENQLYLVMEWVDGESLDFIMQSAGTRGGIPLAIATHWLGQTLLGLHAAHELTDDKGAPLGVVHRDVSPHNVLITYSGVAKLVDFGIAKAMNQSTTFSGEIKGKLSYIAPEQVMCETVDRRADIFSLGVMLYLLTTGQHPFRRPNSAGVLQGITGAEPATPPSQLVRGYPPRLEELVLKALQKQPDQRWSTAEEMFGALQRAMPQAFETGIEAQVKLFLNDILGERAVMRRDALRRAQLAADSRAAGGTEANKANSARSGTSLRAVSVDGGSPRSDPRRRGYPAESAPAARSRWRIAALTGIGALVMLIGAALALRTAGTNERANAAPPGALDLTDVGALKKTRDQPPSSALHTLELPLTQSGDVSSGPAVEAPSTLAAPEARPTSTATRPEGRKARRSSARNSDLMKPDYAR